MIGKVDERGEYVSADDDCQWAWVWTTEMSNGSYCISIGDKQGYEGDDYLGTDAMYSLDGAKRLHKALGEAIAHAEGKS